NGCSNKATSANYLSISSLSLNKSKSLSDTSLINESLQKSLRSYAERPNRLTNSTESSDLALPTSHHTISAHNEDVFPIHSFVSDGSIGAQANAVPSSIPCRHLPLALDCWPFIISPFHCVTFI